jgi:hypothetical protein
MVVVLSFCRATVDVRNFRAIHRSRLEGVPRLDIMIIEKPFMIVL